MLGHVPAYCVRSRGYVWTEFALGKVAGPVGIVAGTLQTGDNLLNAFEESKQRHSPKPIIVQGINETATYAGGAAGGQIALVIAGTGLGIESGPVLIVIVIVGSVFGSTGAEAGVQPITTLIEEFPDHPVDLMYDTKDVWEALQPPPEENSFLENFFGFLDVFKSM